jgi:hypothetical protein
VPYKSRHPCAVPAAQVLLTLVTDTVKTMPTDSGRTTVGLRRYLRQTLAACQQSVSSRPTFVRGVPKKQQADTRHRVDHIVPHRGDRKLFWNDRTGRGSVSVPRHQDPDRRCAATYTF